MLYTPNTGHPVLGVFFINQYKRQNVNISIMSDGVQPSPWGRRLFPQETNAAAAVCRHDPLP